MAARRRPPAGPPPTGRNEAHAAVARRPWRWRSLAARVHRASTGAISTLRDNGAWRSLVAHLLWEQGVAGSNPAAPMSETPEGQRTEAHGPPEEGTEDHGQIPTTCPPTPLMRHLGLMMAVLAAALALAAPAVAAPNEWRIVPSPSPRSTGSALAAVSCLPLGRCVAVGDTATESLIEAGNGISWSRVPAPPTPTASSLHLSGGV